MEFKYIVLFPLQSSELVYGLMDAAARLSGRPPEYDKLIPHVTFHKPIVVDEDLILGLAKSASLRIKATRLRVNSLDHFGRHYIVMPVQATRRLAAFWVDLWQTLGVLPEYTHDEHDHDNTLHITIASKVSDIFYLIWPKMKEISIEGEDIPIERIEVCRKPVQGGRWEKIAEFKLGQG